MRRALCTLLLLPIAAAVFCPIYGPAFPAPSSLAQSSTFRLALKNLTSTLDAAFASGNSSLGPVETTSANAIQVFSLNDDESPLYEYYRSGSILSPAGVQKVDGDSVMRIGSISKLITVYMVLAELGDKAWDFKITEVVPELKNWNRTEWEENPLYHVNWDEITLGSLAGHLSGIAVSVIDQGALGQAYTQFGLPQLPVSEQPACSYANNCTREEFFEQLGRRNPVHLPNTTPAYNGAGIMLLAYALESLTGKSYEQTLQSVLIEPLKLSGTSYSKPDDSKGVIPYNSSTSLWGFNAGTGTSQGGLYSSLNDLAKMGRSILGSSIIDKNTTRAWLKPTSFTSTMMGAVGRPWEIYRVSDTIPDHIVDLYTKGGDVGQYRSILALAPDYNIGFVVAVAGRGDHRWVDQTIIESVFPALEAAARDEATAAYAGTYVATNGLNSSMTITSDEGKPGLNIASWTSNNTDFLQVMRSFGNVNGEFRAFPTNLEQKSGNGKKVAWRVTPHRPGLAQRGPLSGCRTWFSIDWQALGSSAIDELIFELDGDGKAMTVELRAFKATLVKQ